MMDYEMFKGVVAEKFKEFLPEKMQSAKVEIREVQKVNKTMDGLSLVNTDAGMSISPTIYINDMYEKYKATDDLNETIMNAAKGFMEAMQNKDSLIPMIDLDDSKDKIIFQLINTEQNKEMLEDMPHREFKDLSIPLIGVAEGEHKYGAEAFEEFMARQGEKDAGEDKAKVDDVTVKRDEKSR